MRADPAQRYGRSNLPGDCLCALRKNSVRGTSWGTVGIFAHSNLATPLTHTRLTAFCPGLPGVSRYQKGKTNRDFTEARDSEWQWHQLGRMQVCTSLQADNHASNPPLTFLQAGCPSCRPTNSVKALKAISVTVALDNQRNTKCYQELTNSAIFIAKTVQSALFSGFTGQVKKDNHFMGMTGVKDATTAEKLQGTSSGVSK